MCTTNDKARQDTLLTIEQASTRLSISKSLLRSELLKHQLPVVRMGRRLFIPRQSCDDLVARHSDFDGLIPSQSRMGKFSGGTRSSMLLGTPG